MYPLWFVSFLYAIPLLPPFMFHFLLLSVVPSTSCILHSAESERDLSMYMTETNIEGHSFLQPHPSMVTPSTTLNSVHCSSSPAIHSQNLVSAPPSKILQRHYTVGVPTPPTSNISTIPSQISTSLQRLVQSNLSATIPLTSSAIPKKPSVSENQQSQPRFTHSSICSNRRHPPIPLSIKSTQITTTLSEEVVSPLTPLSPYSGQQGMTYKCH